MFSVKAPVDGSIPNSNWSYGKHNPRIGWFIIMFCVFQDMAMGPGGFHIFFMAMLRPNPEVVKHAQTVALIDVVCQKCSSLVSHADFNKPCVMESSKKGSNTIKFQ